MDTVFKHGYPPYRVALLHGGPGAAGELRPVARRLSKETGILELHQTGMSIDEQLDEVYSQCLFAGEFPMIIAGYSWGAWLAFLFAAKYPDHVSKLILISAGPFELRYGKKIMEIRFDRLLPAEREEFDRLVKVFPLDKEDEWKDLRKLILKSDVYDPISKGEAKISFNSAIYHSVWKEASFLRDSGRLLQFSQRIKCPVVAIHGDYDPHPLEGVELPLKNHLARFKIIALKKCGHIPWLEQESREEFYKNLLNEISIPGHGSK